MAAIGEVPVQFQRARDRERQAEALQVQVRQPIDGGRDAGLRGLLQPARRFGLRVRPRPDLQVIRAQQPLRLRRKRAGRRLLHQFEAALVLLRAVAVAGQQLVGQRDARLLFAAIRGGCRCL